MWYIVARKMLASAIGTEIAVWCAMCMHEQLNVQIGKMIISIALLWISLSCAALANGSIQYMSKPKLILHIFHLLFNIGRSRLTKFVSRGTDKDK